MSYIQKNNFNYYKLFYLVKKAGGQFLVHIFARKLVAYSSPMPLDFTDV